MQVDVGGRVISFQLWAWRTGTDIYDLEHFQVHEGGDGTWNAERRTAVYRAWTRAALSGLATDAGLRDVTWHMPHETSFFQPVMTAHRPACQSPANPASLRTQPAVTHGPAERSTPG